MVILFKHVIIIIIPVTGETFSCLNFNLTGRTSSLYVPYNFRKFYSFSNAEYPGNMKGKVSFLTIFLIYANKSNWMPKLAVDQSYLHMQSDVKILITSDQCASLIKFI